MPDLRTEITEIVTGLATLGYDSPDETIESQPPEMIGVEDSIWRRLRDALQGGRFSAEFQMAWTNGVAFLAARSGLRGRKPFRIEWRGPHRNPGFDFIPADLRIDHVYLVSCKYRSRLLLNASPSFLFERLLADREGPRDDWFQKAAPSEYQKLYSKTRQSLPFGPDLPQVVTELSRGDRNQLKSALERKWPAALHAEYVSFARAVAAASAHTWLKNMTSKSRKEEMLWRLLRLAPAPYFVLGISSKEPIRLRVQTPWDWRKEFELRSFDVLPDPQAGQPVVRWIAKVLNRSNGSNSLVRGHVEVRWGHGKFGSSPEAKVYLDTPYPDVPGYVSLD